MKTSSKLILAIIIVAGVALVIYDMAIRSSFLRGDYKNPYRDYVSLNFKDFKSIDLQASTVANVLVKQGPFSVKISPDAMDFVKMRQYGDTLSITATFAGSYYNIWPDHILIISCPALSHLNTDSRYHANGKLVTDSLAGWDFRFRPSVITGFALDSLAITEHHAGNLILKNNKIRSVTAIVGIGDKCRSNLIITDDNQFGNADLDILNYSQLQLHNTHIGTLKYSLADSTKLIQYGGTPDILNKKN